MKSSLRWFDVTILITRVHDLCCRLSVCLVCVRMAKHMRTVHHRLVGPFILVFQISTTFPKFHWDCEYKRSVEIWRFYSSCITDRVNNKRRSSCVDVATWPDFVCLALDRPSSVVAYCNPYRGLTRDSPLWWCLVRTEPIKIRTSNLLCMQIGLTMVRFGLLTEDACCGRESARCFALIVGGVTCTILVMAVTDLVFVLSAVYAVSVLSHGVVSGVRFLPLVYTFISSGYWLRRPINIWKRRLYAVGPN